MSSLVGLKKGDWVVYSASMNVFGQAWEDATEDGCMHARWYSIADGEACSPAPLTCYGGRYTYRVPDSVGRRGFDAVMTWAKLMLAAGAFDND